MDMAVARCAESPSVRGPMGHEWHGDVGPDDSPLIGYTKPGASAWLPYTAHHWCYSYVLNVSITHIAQSIAFAALA